VSVEVERIDADREGVEQLTLGEIGRQHGPASESVSRRERRL
jgi:hypothetical protein